MTAAEEFLRQPHACFQLGIVAGLAIAVVVACGFGWAFIAAVELGGSSTTRSRGPR